MREIFTLSEEELLGAWNRFMIDNKTAGIKEEQFTLKSKRKSYWYINWRTPSSSVQKIDEMADMVHHFLGLKGLDKRWIFGIPDGVTKLGLLLQYKDKEKLGIYRGPGLEMIDSLSLLDGAYNIVRQTKELGDKYGDLCFVGYPGNSLAKELGIVTQYEWSLSKEDFKRRDDVLAMVRTKPKDHGDPKDQEYVGVPKGNVVVIVDGEMAGDNHDYMGMNKLEGTTIVGVVYTEKIPKNTPDVEGVYRCPEVMMFHPAKRGKIVGIEDVTTTGISTMEQLKKLRAYGENVEAVISLSNREEFTPHDRFDSANPELISQYRELYRILTNREYVDPAGVKEAINNAGIGFYPMSSGSTLIPQLIKGVDETLANKVIEEFRMIGTKELRL